MKILVDLEVVSEMKSFEVLLNLLIMLEICNLIIPSCFWGRLSWLKYVHALLPAGGFFVVTFAALLFASI